MFDLIEDYLSSNSRYLNDRILLPCRYYGYENTGKWYDRFVFEDFGVLTTGEGFKIEAGGNVDWSMMYLNYSDGMITDLPLCGVISDDALLICSKHGILTWLKDNFGTGRMLYMKWKSDEITAYASMFKGINIPCIDIPDYGGRNIHVTEKKCLLSDLVDRSCLNKYRGRRVACLSIQGLNDNLVLFIENGGSIILSRAEFERLVRLGLRSVCRFQLFGVLFYMVSSWFFLPVR